MIKVSLSLILVLATSGFAPLAQDAPAGDALDNILVIVAQFATLVGISALITALVNLGFRFGWISDETASQATAVLNLVAFVILAVVGIFRPDLSLSFLDETAARIAAIALFVLGLLTQMVTPAKVNKALFQARVPLVGVRPVNE